MNVSCPNTAHGGMFFSSDPGLLAEVVGAVRKQSKRPLIVKLSPNVTDIADIARVVEAAEAGVTHGEIVGCLRKELGFGRPLIVA